MAGSYPTAVTTYTNPGPTTPTATAVGGRTHDQFHGDVNDDLEQVMSKLGTGVSLPAANTVLRGAAGGASAFGQIVAGDIAAGAITGRGSTFLVAASNAHANVRATADYLCDGVDDQIEINAALAALPSIGGTVLLSEGTFTTRGSVATSKANSVLKGQGWGATLIYQETHASSNAVAILMPHNQCHLSDLTINSNKAGNVGRASCTNLNVSGNEVTLRNVIAINAVGNGVTISGAQCAAYNLRVQTAGGAGLVISGTQAIVEGCFFSANVGEGLHVLTANVLVIGNQFLSNTGSGLVLAGGSADCYVAGNLFRSNAGYGISNSGTNNFLGHNDTHSNTTGAITDVGTNTRRTVKLQLDYVGASMHSGTAVTAGAVVPFLTNQTFRVDSATSYVEIYIRAMVQVALTAVGSVTARLTIDDVYEYYLGGEMAEVASAGANPFGGGGAVLRVASMAVGNHTVKIALVCSQAGAIYQRANGYESFQMQVIEVAR